MLCAEDADILGRRLTVGAFYLAIADGQRVVLSSFCPKEVLMLASAMAWSSLTESDSQIESVRLKTVCADAVKPKIILLDCVVTMRANAPLVAGQHDDKLIFADTIRTTHYQIWRESDCGGAHNVTSPDSSPSMMGQFEEEEWSILHTEPFLVGEIHYTL